MVLLTVLVKVGIILRAHASDHMQIQNISFQQFSQFSYRDVEYQLNPEKFLDFIGFLPDFKGLKKAVQIRKQYPVDRPLLVRVLEEQYAGYSLSSKQQNNINNLRKEDTFTITTAHQPALFTGPAYYMYKILSTVRLAEELSLKMPGINFVPVFVNGSEDHDFEEVNHTFLFNKQVAWNNHKKGPVGKYNIEGLADAIAEFSKILGQGEKAVKLKNLLSDVYNKSRNYNDFTRGLLHGLTARYGLLVLNMDNPDLKRAFIPVMKRELLGQVSEKIVLETQQKLAEAGYKPQAFPRPINLFYFTEDGGRERVLMADELYTVNGTAIQWTKEEILSELNKRPENFSPNVVLRPVYQESILPDLAFVGGGGEIAYWMERKEQFRAFNVFFPVLIRRNSVFIVVKSTSNIMEKLNMRFIDFIHDEEKIIHEFLAKSGDSHDLFEKQKLALDDLWGSLSVHVTTYDKTLTGFMEAEKSKMVKIIDHVEQKLYRARKQHEETKIQQLKNVKEKLFPNKNIQERVDNFFQFYLQYEEDLLDILVEELNPLDKDCKILFL